MIIEHAFTLLTQDVAPLGLLSAPLISWYGSAGLMIFAAWQITRLFQQSVQTMQPFARVSRGLAKLVQERQHQDQDSLALHPPGALTNRPQAAAHFDRRDGKDFQLIDTTFQREPWLASAWKQYHKTLITEQVAWYMEPRIFSSRPAQELFSLETIFRGRLNLAWYQQVPSLLTGMGLLLTFIALLIGLSKLHADGHTIVGIQGLINGLAGKFLTSIVGLVCATLFTLIEKPLLFRLFSAHQQCTHLIDELFPRKTLEQILEGMTGTVRRPPALEQSMRYSGFMPDTLTQPLKAMTQSLDVLTRELRAHLITDKMSAITPQSNTLAEAFAPLIQQLTTALKQFPQQLELPSVQPSSSNQEVNHLVDDLTARITQKAPQTSAKPVNQLQGWIRRLRNSTGPRAPLSAVIPTASRKSGTL